MAGMPAAAYCATSSSNDQRKVVVSFIESSAIRVRSVVSMLLAPRPPAARIYGLRFQATSQRVPTGVSPNSLRSRVWKSGMCAAP